MDVRKCNPRLVLVNKIGRCYFHRICMTCRLQLIIERFNRSLRYACLGSE